MAGKSLGTLTLDLIAKVGGFVDGLSKAEREAKKRSDSISKSIGAIGTAAGAMAAGVAAGTAALIKSQIDLADEYSKQSAILGIAIEDWSALNYATDLAGVSNDQLSAAITKLNKNIVSSVDGTGAAADAFKVLGINVKNTDGTLKDSYTVLTELADAFAGIEDGATKTALAQDLLGKSGAKMIPLLNGGSQGLADMREEAERLGQVISAETGIAAEEFNDNLTRLQKVISGTGNELAAELVPTLAEFTALINEPETQESIKALVKGLADITIGAVKLTSAIIGATKDLGEFFAIAANGPEFDDLQGINKEIDQISDLINNRLTTLAKNPLMPTRLAFANEEELIDRLGKLLKRRDEILDDVPASPSGSSAQSGEDPEKKALKDRTKELETLIGKLKEQKDAETEIANQQKEIQNAFDSALQGYKEQTIAIGEITEAQKARFETEEGSLKALTAEQKTQIIQAAEMADAYKLLGDAAEEAGKKQEESLRERKTVTEQLRTEQEKATQEMLHQLDVLQKMDELSASDRKKLSDRSVDMATEKAPRFGGLSPEFGGETGELMKVDDAAKELEDWYAKQLEIVNAGRESQHQANVDWDAQELELKRQHQEELARIDMARETLALTSAESLFGSLSEVAKATAGENSKAYRAAFALEKAASIARATMAIQTGIAMAAANPFPANLAAMASVAAATASIVSSISSVGMAHDGIDSIPKTGTWLLEKGERVTTERTSAKLDKTLDDVVASNSSAPSGISIGQMVFPNVKNERDAMQAGGAVARQLTRMAGYGRRYS